MSPERLTVSSQNELASGPSVSIRRPVYRKHLQRWALAYFALHILSGCSTQQTAPTGVVAESPRPANPTLEPTPAESEYSFGKAYRERYGDDFVDGQSEKDDER